MNTLIQTEESYLAPQHQDYSPKEETAITIIGEVEELLKDHSVKEAFEFCNEEESAMIKVLGDSGVLKLLEELDCLCVSFENDIFYEKTFDELVEKYETLVEIGVYDVYRNERIK